MAEIERSHRSSSINSSSSTSDFFICFTSRHHSSSTSMRLSKSILSPGSSASLSTSLSRRLRSSGSMKSAGGGGVLAASPMFGTTGRKKTGTGLENNPEPSSPKVTCIGQVRVKTRKHVKKRMRARSRRKGGETSFRRSGSQDSGRGRGWVHLPMAICESLKSFGSELNCFSSPCKSSCRSSCTHGDNRRNREGKRSDNDRCGPCGGKSSCGAVFARWFVDVEGTGGERKEVELVVGDEEEEVQVDRRRGCRRHVFENIDFSEIEVKAERKERGGESGKVGVCAPPTNALLLMRCRSDPVKVAALANRVRATALTRNDDEEDKQEEMRRFEIEMEDKKRIEICEKWIFGESIPQRESAEAKNSEKNLVSDRQKEEEEEAKSSRRVSVSAEEEAKSSRRVSVSAEEEAKIVEDLYSEEAMEAKFIQRIEDELRNLLEEEMMADVGDFAEAAATADTVDGEEETMTVTLNQERSGSGEPIKPNDPEPDPSPVLKDGGIEAKESEKQTTPYQVLPDCLLLMMCEPKLSMEVSKETWVCKTDFVKWLPERPPPANKPIAADQPKKRIAVTESNASSRRRSIDKPPLSNSVLLQPPRSSCSYPAAPPLAAASEQKAGASESPSGRLTRCKSEPRRSLGKPAAQEACFWKNNKLEPHRPATLGVGRAGVGF